jgi:hypothetical protein
MQWYFPSGKVLSQLEMAMGDTHQSQPAGAGSSQTAVTAALGEIQRRRAQVIRAVLVPRWYWWVMAAGMVAIGAARDSGDKLVQATTIPLAVLVMAVLTGAMIPVVRRRVQVHSTSNPGARGAAAIVGLIVLVDAAILVTAASLAAAGFRYPGTVATAAGATVLVIAGPLVNGYLYRLMASRPPSSK